MIRTYEVTGTAQVEFKYKTWITAEEGEDLADYVEALINGGELTPEEMDCVDPGITGWRKV